MVKAPPGVAFAQNGKSTRASSKTVKVLPPPGEADSDAPHDGLHELIIKVAAHQRKSITRIQAAVRKQQAVRRWRAVRMLVRGGRWGAVVARAARPSPPPPRQQPASAEAPAAEVEAIVDFLREEPALLEQVQKVAGHQRRSVSKLQAIARGRSIRRSPRAGSSETGSPLVSSVAA